MDLMDHPLKTTASPLRQSKQNQYVVSDQFPITHFTRGRNRHVAFICVCHAYVPKGRQELDEKKIMHILVWEVCARVNWAEYGRKISLYESEGTALIWDGTGPLQPDTTALKPLCGTGVCLRDHKL